MGKAFGGVFANWTKKVGNVVGRVVNGENIYSIYQPNVSNPNTLLQQKQRYNFTLIVKLGSAVLGAINTGYKKIAQRGRVIGEFISKNITNVTGTWPNVTVDFSKIIMAQGSLALPYNPSASVNGNEVDISWTDNSGEGEAYPDDFAAVVLYNKDKEIATYDVQASERATGSATFNVPATWSGDKAECYLFMSNKDNVSNSVFLGELSLA